MTKEAEDKKKERTYQSLEEFERVFFPKSHSERQKKEKPNKHSLWPLNH